MVRANRKRVQATRRPKGASRPRPLTVDPEEFYSRMCEGFGRSRGSWAFALCPFHDDKAPSLAINIETGGYFCRSSHCAVRGGDIVSFVMRREGLSYREALRWIEENL